MRILVYGFGPYRQFRDNITARIIKSLPRQAGLKKIIFPVRFQRHQFIDALDRYKPDIILGLGQSSRTRIEVESRARNRRRARKLEAPRPIFKNKPASLATTLPIHAGRGAGRSNNAGDYVCNYSMFVLLAEIGRRELKTRFGFVHIPYDCDERKARRLVQRILRRFDGLRAKPQRPIVAGEFIRPAGAESLGRHLWSKSVEKYSRRLTATSETNITPV